MESSSRTSELEQRIPPFRHGSYQMLVEIGKGSFARVMKARHIDNGSTFAVKMVKKKRLNEKLTANLQTEIQIMKNTRHPGIIRLYESFDTEGHVNLVMEYCKLGDMSRIIKHAGKLSTFSGFQEMDRRHPSYQKALNPVLVRLFSRQLVDAIRFLHHRNLIHRDIKPQNILLDLEDLSNMTSDRLIVLERLAKAIGVNVNSWKWLPLVKLADFGFARHLPSTSLAETLCGSPLYMGPEILRYERYDAKTDLWSLGAVIFEMLTGKPPFRAKNHIELLRRIDTTAIEFPKPATNYPGGTDYPKDLQKFILGLLKKKPVERMSFETTFNHDAMVSPLTDMAPDDCPGTITTLPKRPGSSKLNDNSHSSSRPGSSRSVKSAFQSSTQAHTPRRSNTTDGVNLAAAEGSHRTSKRTPTMDEDGFTRTPVTSARSPSSSALNAPIEQRTSSRGITRAATTGLGIQDHSQNLGFNSSRTRGPAPTEVAHAIEDAISPGIVAPTDRLSRRSSNKEQKSKSTSHRTTPEMAFERDYVVVEKKQVEVNAMADEMAASPRGHDNNQLVRRHQSSTAVNIPGRSSQGNNQGPIDLTPPASRSPSSISRAIQGATMRFFGVKFSPSRIARGQSPPMYNPYSAGCPPPTVPSLLTDGRNNGEPQFNESRVAQMIEDFANRSDCIWSFAEIKFQQLIPERTSSDVRFINKSADELSDLTDDAVVVLSEEALLLYVKALEILATAIDSASQWWASHSRVEDGCPRTTDRINGTVQWLRNRFNDTLEKVELVRLRLIQAQERLPENHPAHPSHHTQNSSLNIDSGNLNVYISSRTTADKLIYDRALEMCKHAAGDEMCKRNLSVCETYYSTALRMMEALLDRTDDNRSTNGETGYGELDHQEEEDQLHLMKMISAIRGRLAATQHKMQAMTENEKLHRGSHRHSGSNTPASVNSN